MKGESIRERGQSTLEMLIVVAILTAALGGAVLAYWSSQSLSVDSMESAKALRLARAQLEAAEALARDNFASLTSTVSVYREFTEQLVVTPVDAATAQVTSRVTWRTDPLRIQKVELNALLTDWYAYQATGGNTGGSGLSGDWLHPKTLGSINLGPNEQATNLNVKNAIVYITTSVSNANKPNFYVVDATNGSSPVVDSSLSTGSTGLNDVIVAGHYAYVANNSTTAQLQVIDVSSASGPTLVSSLTLNGVSGAGALGWSVAYYNGYVYIGTKKADGPEFHIVNVANPAAPTEVGSYEVNADVNAITVSGNTAYLATGDTSAQLKILNVQNPAAVTLSGTFSPPTGTAGASLNLAGEMLYMGFLNNSQKGFYILDVTNASSVKTLGSQYTGSDVNGLLMRNGLLFLATSDTNSEFQVWSVGSPSSISEVSSFNFPNIAEGIDYENNIVYVAVRSNDALRIITSQ